MLKKKSDNQDFLNQTVNLRKLEGYLDRNDLEILEKEIRGYHPSDIASLIQTLNFQNRKKILKILQKDFDSQILIELKSNFLKKIIFEFDFKVIFNSIQEFDFDDSITILRILNAEYRSRILESLPEKYSLTLQRNLKYSENTAGRLMQSETVKVPQTLNVGQVIDFLRNEKGIPKSFYDIFVVNEKNILLGTVALSTLITSKGSKKIKNIIKLRSSQVHYSIDQEEVADLFRKRNLTSMAVVNNKNELLGSIYIDDIVDVIDTEAEEDLLKLSGIGEQSFYDAVISVTKARFTWLMFNLIAAFIASIVIKNFEGTIEKLALLAALMPIVASMGGCSGTQSLTTAVRAISMKQLTMSNALRSTGKEIIVGFLNGFLFAIISGFLSYIIFGEFNLSLIISISLLLNLVFGSFLGTVVPIILTRVGVDPALASGTFVIMLTDIFGFFIFLALASIYIIN